MPIMQAFFRSLGTSGQTRYIPSSISLSLSLLVWLCHSSSPCHSVFPSLSFVLHPHCWPGEERWADRDRIRWLSASSGRAWRSSAFSRGVKQRVTRSRSWRTSCKSVCPQSHTLPPVDGACQCSLSLPDPLSYSSSSGRSCLKNRKESKQ